MTKMRIYAIAVTVLLVGATLLPVLQIGEEAPVDSFPLSYYPMFSQPRAELETPIYVLGFDSEGQLHKISYPFWTSGGFNQASMQLKAARHEGQAALDEMCGTIASNVGKTSRGPLADVDVIVIERGHYSLVKYFRDGDRTPERKATLATCKVQRP